MNELNSLRFVEDHRNVVVLGPVGVGKTFLANALGHLCCRAGFNVRMLRADALLRLLKQSRMDNSRDAVVSEKQNGGKCVQCWALMLREAELYTWDLAASKERMGRTAKTATAEKSLPLPLQFLAAWIGMRLGPRRRSPARPRLPARRSVRRSDAGAVLRGRAGGVPVSARPRGGGPGPRLGETPTSAATRQSRCPPSWRVSSRNKRTSTLAVSAPWAGLPPSPVLNRQEK
jgi:hypothetical protein